MSETSDPVVNALPVPVSTVGPEGRILSANPPWRRSSSGACASCSGSGSRMSSVRVAGGDSSRRCAGAGSSVASTDRHRLAALGQERIVDVFATPLGGDGDAAVLMLQERTIADKMDRQLTHRGARRSLTALGAMLAHEIKNPLSGIKGAARFLEQSANEDDPALTTLICAETERIVKLVERMELFGDERPVEPGPVNVHGLPDHGSGSAGRSSARHIRFVENYDPSRRPCSATGISSCRCSSTS